MKLVQKQFLQGRREFEIIDDAVNVRIKTPFREEKLTVMLAVIDPEPVANGSLLEFYSRVRDDEPLLSLLPDKPNPGEYNAFVDALKRRAREEYRAFAGIRSVAGEDVLPGNVYEAPPDFDTPAVNRPAKSARPVNIENIDTAIRMLEQYLDAGEIRPLLAALEALKDEPENESRIDRLVESFGELGTQQGAVLTYAPYVGVLLSNNSFDN